GEGKGVPSGIERAGRAGEGHRPQIYGCFSCGPRFRLKSAVTRAGPHFGEKRGKVDAGYSARGRTKGTSMTDYWLSKLVFDLQHDEKLAAEFRSDMAAVIGRYEIKPEIRKALLEDDVGTIAPRVN